MNTYGMHSIHGRAPAFATGLKSSRPELSVWVITGDGDALSIGGNHLLHVLRRNVDVNILLFNNRIYGLTKGQYSPTSEVGKRTKSTPFGSIDSPLRPLSIVLGANATFVARSIDREPKHLCEMIKRVHAHKGTSFLEIYQNCNIFNDGAFAPLTDRKLKGAQQLILKDGQPLVFDNGEKGIVFDGFSPQIVDVADVGIDAIHVHDERESVAYHHSLATMAYPEMPTPIGVFRAVEAPSYDEMLNAQLGTARDRSGVGDLSTLLNSGDTWEVK
jgi:2-oxoglutarate ferredoxin oxidoreductase subunit beta